MNAPPRVLCYAPYNRWLLHGQWETTILHGLRLRGADVRHVLCDGLYTDCDVWWGTIEPRHPLSCTQCQSEVTALAFQMRSTFEWLGRYLTLDERREARRWERGLTRDALATATYGDWEVARWVVGSVHSHFRSSRLDLADPEVERVFRSYLYSGLVACFALDRLLDEHAPDVVLAYNGRQSSTRVMFELTRRRGIRIVCHERGPRLETITLTVDDRCISLAALDRFWEDWRDVPLTPAEVAEIGSQLAAREHGTDYAFRPYNPPPQALEEVRERLGLRADRPVWALFTSSDDEVVSEAEWQGAFATQLEWIGRTLAFAEAHPEIDLVVRVHPNTGGRKSTGVNHGQLQEMTELAARLPANVRVVMPDEELSSYTLMDVATVGLVYHSTVGIELACKGKAVVVAGGNMVSRKEFVHTVDEAERYEELLEPLLELPVGAVLPGVRTLAWRFAYGRWFRTCVHFPLVRMPTASTGELTYATLDELRPGCDAGLDRCARILLEDEPTCPPPGPAERARSVEDERRALLGVDCRRFAAVAFAEELIETPSLLRSWADAFSADDDATLVIHAPDHLAEELAQAVEAVALDREDGPDLLAVDALPSTFASSAVVFSRRVPDGLLGTAPRFDETRTRELRAYAETFWAAA